MDESRKDTIKAAIETVDRLIKHFSLENDERHYAPHNWDITERHDETDDPDATDGEQKPHGVREGVRRRATALTALKRRRGNPEIPKWVALIEMSIEQLDQIGRKHFGDKWEDAIEETAGGTSNNLDVRDVPVEALETEDEGPVNTEILRIREQLKEMARARNPKDLNVKDINEMSDDEVIRLARGLANRSK